MLPIFGTFPLPPEGVFTLELAVVHPDERVSCHEAEKRVEVSVEAYTGARLRAPVGASVYSARANCTVHAVSGFTIRSIPFSSILLYIR